MIEYRNLKDNELELMCNLWNEVMAEEGFYRPLDYSEYKEKMLSYNDFSFERVFGAFDGDKLVGFVVGLLKGIDRLQERAVPYLHSVVVKKEYRKQGIGSKLLNTLEDYFKALGKQSIDAHYYLPYCYEWYIPHTDHHNHPCAPGIRINSEEYFFLLHRGYESFAFEDAFHLDLSDYEISPSIQKVLDENKTNGITIELYDPNKHYGLEEFYKELNIYDFEKVIRENLALEKPYPFLVVAKDNKIVGWTGAMWNEPSGRGHFDGIAILSSVRGSGLGKALFSLLAYNSKLNGAKFMTFYTGLTNHARYIYMKAGFKIIQSYALMKKKLN